MDFTEGIGLVGMIFLIYAAVLAWNHNTYVFGIAVNSREINNNLETMNENLQTLIAIQKRGRSEAIEEGQ